MKIKVIIFLAILSVLQVSCDDFLDVVPDDIATIDNAFTIREQAEKYLFTCYSYIPNHADVRKNPAFLAGDEFWVSNYFRDYQAGGFDSPFRILTGEQNADDPILDFWRGVNGGEDLYRGISDCNIFLEKIHDVPNMDDAEKQKWIAEVKFLKAYFHFWLVRMYGPIAIKDFNVPVNAPESEVNVFRNTIDECFDYVVGLMDEVLASPYLPDQVEDAVTENGRICKSIVHAIKAEVLVTAASPLYNGNPLYSNMNDSRGINIFNAEKSEEEKQERWNQAVQACKEAIDFAENIGHSLYEYNSFEYQMSDTTRAKLSIRNAITEKWNSEIIWGNSNALGSKSIYTPTGTFLLQMQGFPRGLDPKRVANTTKVGNLAVTLKMAKLFYTNNGVPIDEDVTWEYNDRLDVLPVPESHKYYMKEGYNTIKFNLNRELRYYASLTFDGCLYYGMGELDDKKSYYAQVKKGQPAGNFIEFSTNLTGFWPKKLTHFKSSLHSGSSGFTTLDYAWPVMRLSNLYLLYAEALNESGNNAESLVYLNKVRTRAGIPNVQDAWTNFSKYPNKFTTKEGLREIIQQERSIELAFEGQRFWDVKRWNLADEYFNEPITGWNTRAKEEKDYYKEQLLFQPVFLLKDYFWPIMHKETLSNNNLIQNYEW